MGTRYMSESFYCRFHAYILPVGCIMKNMLVGLAIIVVSATLAGAHSMASAASAYVHAQGASLQLQGQPFRFQAICFGNNYMRDHLDHVVLSHHTVDDYRRVQGLGFNSIRFAFNGNWYHDDQARFWSWLDQNIDWAKQHQLRLILDLHVPIGSYWLNPNSPKVNFSLWENPSTRQQNISMWRAIAKRYLKEPVVGGYDILNEPVTTDQDGQQWQRLANDIIDAIRLEDRNHLIVVERLYGVNQRYGVSPEQSQFLVRDTNVLYDFHFYEPVQYPYQNGQRSGRPLPDGWRYPDASQLTSTGQQVLNTETLISSASLPEGDNGWQDYASQVVTVRQPGVVAATPQMVLRGGASGRVWFDEVRVLEYDSEGQLLGEIWREPLSNETIGQWWGWQQHAPSPADFVFQRDTTQGANDQSCLSFQLRDLPDETFGGWSSDTHWLPITPGHAYRIVGKLKGEGIRYTNPGRPAQIGFQLAFFEHPPDGVGVVRGDISHLRHHFMRFYQFGRKHEVPMSVLETGLVRDVFEHSEKGAATWVRDLLRLFNEHRTSYAYWKYHGDKMGLFLSPAGQGVSQPNKPLLDTFITVQKEPSDSVYQGTPPEQDSTVPPAAAVPLAASYQSPPAGLRPAQVPQFVVIGFDDNTQSPGLDWAMNLFDGKYNPAGDDQKATYDGTPARVSFYMNTIGMRQWREDDPKTLAEGVRRLYQQGHEVANHTDNHHSGIDPLTWERIESTIITMQSEDWRARMQQGQDDLISLAGIPPENLVGFRAPFLLYNQAMYDTLAGLGFTYDCSVEEGYSTQFDGHNFRWPYPMSIGAPGHAENWRNNQKNRHQVIIRPTPILWQLPQHVLIVPEDPQAQHYGIPAGLWQRMKQRRPTLANHRITGFDYNLWVNAGLSKAEFLGLLKFNLDLRLEGNRAPFMFGAHSQYYANPVWAKQNVPNASLMEMKSALEEFVAYALSKPVVRIRPARDIIQWVKHPQPLRRHSP